MTSDLGILPCQASAESEGADRTLLRSEMAAHRTGRALMRLCGQHILPMLGGEARTQST